MCFVNHRVMFGMGLRLFLFLTICSGISSGQIRSIKGRQEVGSFRMQSFGGEGPKGRQSLKVFHTNFHEQEGRPVVISGKVEYLLAEAEGKIKVAIAPHAQIFFITRSDRNFEKWLAVLKQARDRKQQVKCTVRTLSGRIESVAVQE